MIDKREQAALRRALVALMKTDVGEPGTPEVKGIINMWSGTLTLALKVKRPKRKP